MKDEDGNALAQMRADALEKLMTELVEALLARGSLKRCDVAGALLRAQWRAMMDEEDGITALPSILPNVEQGWSNRFGLTPELWTLRQWNDKWVRAGMKGRSPIEAAQIVPAFD